MKRARHEVLRATDEFLRAFVLAYCDGAIWTSQDVRAEDVGHVFMPIALGAFRDWTAPELAQLGVIYASMRPLGPDDIADQTTGWAVNGRPMFASCRVMHRDDWARAVEAIKAELERRKTIALPADPSSVKKQAKRRGKRPSR
jgi:hypothetical protein